MISASSRMSSTGCRSSAMGGSSDTWALVRRGVAGDSGGGLIRAATRRASSSMSGTLEEPGAGVIAG